MISSCVFDKKESACAAQGSAGTYGQVTVCKIEEAAVTSRKLLLHDVYKNLSLSIHPPPPPLSLFLTLLSRALVRSQYPLSLLLSPSFYLCLPPPLRPSILCVCGGGWRG